MVIMAKKKKRKIKSPSKTGFKIELKGLLLILIAILGFGRLGIVGKMIGNFSGFLVGSWYNLLLLLVFILGFYMIIKRSYPVFFTSKLTGLYIAFLSVLILSHTNFVKENDINGVKILTETIGNFMDSIDYVKNIKGGGIIGALFSFSFVKLFDFKGTIIVVYCLIIGGFVMFTGISIYDLVKNTLTKLKSNMKFKKTKKDQIDIQKHEDEYESDNKIVISSVDELLEPKKESQTKEESIEDSQSNSNYIFPSINLLKKSSRNKNNINQENVKVVVPIIEKVLLDFGIEGKVVAVNIGPTVTQYEMDIKAGTKLSRLLSIHKEIALALAARDVRIQAPIPGKSTIGIEIPNKVNTMVTVREILENVPNSYRDNKLLVVLGRDIMGKPIYMEINKTPHLLVAGSTGSGKSVCINSMITSILMRTKPDEVKLLLVDPKKVELSMYNGVPHLLAPVVTNPKKANIALQKIVAEMERRYDVFSEHQVKNIAGYNMLVDKQNEKLSEEEKLKKIPFIVVIIDELADLMLVAAKEVEDSIMRITQMARAAGIHLVVATQRPSTDVITGVVKANIPSRISFSVSSSIDSRTILDMTGAEKLLGKGDMLFLPSGENTPIRVQGTYIDEDEIKKIVDHTVSQQKAKYDETLLMNLEEEKSTSMIIEEYDEPLYNDIVEFVLREQKASASLIQRRFRLGYNRAARVIDLLEERGIIGPNNGSKPREVLVELEDKE